MEARLPRPVGVDLGEEEEVGEGERPQLRSRVRPVSKPLLRLRGAKRRSKYPTTLLNKRNSLSTLQPSLAVRHSVTYGRLFVLVS